MSDWRDERYDDSYSDRYAGLRSSEGAGSYRQRSSAEGQEAGDADAARYRRSSYAQGSRDGTYVDRDQDQYASHRYSRADRSRSSRKAGSPDFEPRARHTSSRTSSSRDVSSRSTKSRTTSARAVHSRTAAARDSATRTADAASEDYSSTSTRSSDARSTRAGLERSSGAYTAKRARTSRGLRIAIVAVIAAVVIVVGGILAYACSVTGNLNRGVDNDLRNALVHTDMANEPFYMLLLGTDKSQHREEYSETDGVYRSDSMMLARIDPVNNKATLVSIPRDTLVDLGEYGRQRINAAYTFGGPSLAVKTVSKLAGVDISHYAEIDFDGFSAVVDALGGVEVEVPIDIDDDDAGGSLSAGLQVLDGEQALILARSRESYADTSAAPDLMRAANQRLVISAIAHKVLAADVATIANSINAVSSYVTTDLGLNDIIGLAQAMQGLDPADDIYSASFPTTSVYVQDGQTYPDAYTPIPNGTVDPSIDEGYYLLADETEWAAMKKRMEDGLPPSEGMVVDEATGTVIATAGADADIIVDKHCGLDVENSTVREGLAAKASGMLNASGFANTMIDDPDGREYPQTIVVYDDPMKVYEAQVIVQVLGQGEAVENDGSYYLEGDFLVVIGDDWKSVSADASGSSASTSAASSSSAGAGS